MVSGEEPLLYGICPNLFQMVIPHFLELLDNIAKSSTISNILSRYIDSNAPMFVEILAIGACLLN